MNVYLLTANSPQLTANNSPQLTVYSLQSYSPLLSNSDIKPPLLVVDADRFYRSCERFFTIYSATLEMLAPSPLEGEGWGEGEG